MADALTNVYKDAMRDTWYVVQQDHKTNGVAFFIRLFTENPGFVEYFPKFRGKQLEEFKNSPNLKNHAFVVLKNITQLVEKLDDEAGLVAIMTEIVDDHYPKQIGYAHFEKTFGVLLEVMGAALGDLWTETAREAWTTAFSVLLTVTKARLEVLRANGADSEKK